MKIQVISILALLFFIASCGETDLPAPYTSCGDEIIIDTNYDNLQSDEFTYSNIQIEGNCLSATIQYGGGCDEDLVSSQLLGSTASFPFSLPALLEVKLVLDDDDQCEALVTQTISFDLEPLQDAEYNNINVAIEDWNEVLQYSY